MRSPTLILVWEVSTSIVIGEGTPLDAIRGFIKKVKSGEPIFKLKNLENGNRYLVPYNRCN